MRVKLHAQPFQVLCLLLARPGEMLTREQISRELWPRRHVRRLRAWGELGGEPAARGAWGQGRQSALCGDAGAARLPLRGAGRGDRERGLGPRQGMCRSSSQPRLQPAAPELFAVTIPELKSAVPERTFDRVLASPEDLPRSSHRLVLTLFVLLQAMYLGFYVGALANLAEINELLSPLSWATEAFVLLVASAALLIPVRVFLLCGVLFRAPGMRGKFLRLWPFLLGVDVLWSLAPFLLLHHMSYGLALACTTVLVYAPFAQRSLVLMGAADERQTMPV